MINLIKKLNPIKKISKIINQKTHSLKKMEKNQKKLENHIKEEKNNIKIIIIIKRNNNFNKYK